MSYLSKVGKQKVETLIREYRLHDDAAFAIKSLVRDILKDKSCQTDVRNVTDLIEESIDIENLLKEKGTLNEANKSDIFALMKEKQAVNQRILPEIKGDYRVMRQGNSIKSALFHSYFIFLNMEETKILTIRPMKKEEI